MATLQVDWLEPNYSPSSRKTINGVTSVVLHLFEEVDDAEVYQDGKDVRLQVSYKSGEEAKMLIPASLFGGAQLLEDDNEES